MKDIIDNSEYAYDVQFAIESNDWRDGRINTGFKNTIIQAINQCYWRAPDTNFNNKISQHQANNLYYAL